MTQAPPTSPLPGEEPLPGVSPAYGVPAGSPDLTTAQEQAHGQADPMTPQATTPGQATFGVPASPVPPLGPPPAAAPGASSGSDAPQDDKAKLLPFYLVCDVSYSMVESGALEECNRILPSLVQALEKDPIICDKVRFGVVDFSDDARVLLPLCDLLEQTSLPNLVGRKNTSYKAAFDLLKAEIERNVTQLKADGYQVHRPAVFFLSDGAPTDPPAEWTASFEALTAYDKASGTGNRMYPNIIPFGLQGCDPQVLQQVIYPKNPPERAMRLFLAEQDQTPASAVTKMAKLLVASVIQSGSGLAAGGTGIVLPKAEDGVKSFSADDDVFL
ncbi:MAG: VWA domain-containing protein [Actinobacteria bacterium]|nr:VWA domain-containing protein [Actinomycetota bacterium]